MTKPKYSHGHRAVLGDGLTCAVCLKPVEVFVLDHVANVRHKKDR